MGIEGFNHELQVGALASQAFEVGQAKGDRALEKPAQMNMKALQEAPRSTQLTPTQHDKLRELGPKFQQLRASPPLTGAKLAGAVVLGLILLPFTCAYLATRAYENSKLDKAMKEAAPLFNPDKEIGAGQVKERLANMVQAHKLNHEYGKIAHTAEKLLTTMEKALEHEPILLTQLESRLMAKVGDVKGKIELVMQKVQDGEPLDSNQLSALQEAQRQVKQYLADAKENLKNPEKLREVAEALTKIESIESHAAARADAALPYAAKDFQAGALQQ